jgi:hypothetical protein
MNVLELESVYEILMLFVTTTYSGRVETSNPEEDHCPGDRQPDAKYNMKWISQN